VILRHRRLAVKARVEGGESPAFEGLIERGVHPIAPEAGRAGPGGSGAPEPKVGEDGFDGEGGPGRWR
jgi:hypothetical protein